MEKGILTLRQLLELAELAGATRYFKADAFGVIATTKQSPAVTVRFTRNGFVTAFSGQIDSGAVADYAGTLLRVQLGGTEDLFVDGQGAPTQAGFLELFGGVPARRRIVRRVVKGDLWVFTAQNNTAGNVTPRVTLDFLDDDDLKNLMSALPR